jgi:hypothetical protein
MTSHHIKSNNQRLLFLGSILNVEELSEMCAIYLGRDKLRAPLTQVRQQSREKGDFSEN